MNNSDNWVAFVDEDEDDYIFWQHGFRSWATHLELYWFPSVHTFLTASSIGKPNPAALLLDGIAPTGEEAKWLSTLLLHPSCQQACLIMLSGTLLTQQRQTYLQLGATDHLIKPVNLDELQTVVLTVSKHVAAKQR